MSESYWLQIWRPQSSICQRWQLLVKKFQDLVHFFVSLMSVLFLVNLWFLKIFSVSYTYLLFNIFWYSEKNALKKNIIRNIPSW